MGDVEVDLMIGKNHKYSLLVMTDRATLHTRLKKLPGKQAQDVKKAMVETLKNNPYPIKTLTFDNDKAFSEHLEIGKRLGHTLSLRDPILVRVKEWLKTESV